MLFSTEKESEFLTMIYKQHLDTLVRYAFWLCKDVHLADDIVQTSFVKIISQVQTVGRLGSDYKLKAYLYTVVRNTYIDSYNTKKKQPIFVRFEDTEALQTSFQLEDFVVKKIHTKELVTKLLAKLTEQEKDVIMLAYYVGLSYEEIAEVMNLSKSNVGVLLHRIKKKLKKTASTGGDNIEYSKG